jgi:hypothetical protein
MVFGERRSQAAAVLAASTRPADVPPRPVPSATARASMLAAASATDGCIRTTELSADAGRSHLERSSPSIRSTTPTIRRRLFLSLRSAAADSVMDCEAVEDWGGARATRRRPGVSRCGVSPARRAFLVGPQLPLRLTARGVSTGRSSGGDLIPRGSETPPRRCPRGRHQIPRRPIVSIPSRARRETSLRVGAGASGRPRRRVVRRPS